MEDLTALTDEQLRARTEDARDRLKILEAEGRRRRHQIAGEVDRRLAAVLQADPAEAFKPEELRYSAGARCQCGAGLAYPIGVGQPNGAWHCSAILTGEAERGSTHDPGRPWAFWSVKAEGQPSAGKRTTRPGYTTVELDAVG